MMIWPVPAGGQGRVGQDVQQHLALVGLGAGEGEAHGQPVQGAQQVQAQSPEVTRMAGAVPVFGPSGQVRAPGGFPGPAAFHRGGIGNPDVIGPQAGIGREHPDQRGDQPGGGAQPPVIAGLARQVAEQVPQMSMGMPDPARLGGVSQQGLHDRQGDQLSIRQPGLQADRRPPGRQVRNCSAGHRFSHRVRSRGCPRHHSSHNDHGRPRFMSAAHPFA